MKETPTAPLLPFNTNILLVQAKNITQAHCTSTIQDSSQNILEKRLQKHENE